MAAPTLAIDFGTTRTKVAFFDAASGRPRLIELGKEVRAVIPSVFYIPKEGDGERRVGDDALERMDSDPAGIVISLKKEIHKLGKKRCGPDRPAIERVRLASEMFTYIRRRCREEVFHGEDLLNCCLTVPVNFLDQQRQAIREAAQMGGFKEVTTMEEPVAAAYAWLSGHGGPKFGASVMVCDVGGGTTDFAFLRQAEGRFVADDRVLSSGFPEGGDDLDELIWQQASGQDSAPADSNLKSAFLVRIRRERELLPKSKASEVEIRIDGQKCVLSREVVQAATKEFVDRVKTEAQRFLETVRTRAGLSEVPILMVGGASRLPGMKEALETLNAGEVYLWNDSDYATVLGAVPWPDAAKSSTAEASPEKIALFRQALSMAAADGKITHEEVAQLKRLVCDLRLTREIIVDEVSKCLKTGKVENRKDELIQSLCAVAATEPACGLPIDQAALRRRLAADLEEINKGAEDCLFEEDSIEQLSPKRLGDWKAAASLGWPEGLWLMGVHHRENSTEHDPALAAHCFQNAVDAGFTQAQVSLADCYQKGEGVPMDHAKAFQLFQSAAKTGNRDAGFSLAACFFEGKGVPQNYEEALRLFRAAAQTGIVFAHLSIGLCYLNGTGVQENTSEAQCHFKQLYEACQRGAKAGGKFAQLSMGFCYLKGFGVTADPYLAAVWFGKAAAQQCAAAQVQLADCYLNGIGVTADPKRAFGLFHQAAEQGDENAQNKLGFCLLYGIGGTTDPSAACEWFRKSAERGDAEGQYQLGLGLISGIGVQVNEAEGFRWIKQAAGQAYAQAENDMGRCLQNGGGVQPDPQEAVRWYRKSAAQKCADGLYRLALCYQAGVGVRQDQREAISLFRKGAELGHLDCMESLGLLLRQDNTGPANQVEAVQWLQRAAEQEHPGALFDLGVCYLEGTGVAQNEASGFSYIQRAAELNLAVAQSIVGDCWLKGDYFPANPVEAIKWFRKAADQGDYNGQVGLGKCYLNGWGVARDVRMAAKYLEPAANAGHPEAMTTLGDCYATGEL